MRERIHQRKNEEYFDLDYHRPLLGKVWAGLANRAVALSFLLTKEGKQLSLERGHGRRVGYFHRTFPFTGRVQVDVGRPYFWNYPARFVRRR